MDQQLARSGLKSAIRRPQFDYTALGQRSRSHFSSIGVGDGGRGHVPPPPLKKIGKNIFRAIIMQNSGIFGQKSCKIWAFC